MKVPFFRYPHVFDHMREELEAALLRVASGGGYIMQAELRELEERLTEYTGAADVIGVGNATDAMEMVVRDAGIGPGDEVIMPSHTFIASASAVHRTGATLVLAEIGDDHLMDADDTEARITGRTRAVMPTQLNGRVADMDRFRALCDAHGLLLIEDSAQGIGATLDGRMAGTFGAGGVLSFYPAKVLGCLGDGGAVLATHAEQGRRMRELRDHGRDPCTGEVVRWGWNSRLDNIQAAVLLVKLERLDEDIALRRALGARYHENLHDVPQLLLPPPPEEAGRHFDAFQNYEVEAEDRDALRAHLSAHDVGTILQWGGKGVHQFQALGFGDVSLPRTELMFERAMLLPMNTSLTPDEVDYVCEQIRAFYG